MGLCRLNGPWAVYSVADPISQLGIVVWQENAKAKRCLMFEIARAIGAEIKINSPCIEWLVLEQKREPSYSLQRWQGMSGLFVEGPDRVVVGYVMRPFVGRG